MELQHLTRLGKRIGLSLIFFLAIPANLVKAQVVPDGTLESTVETIQELMKIDGGLTEGSNLFHSFEEFNIPEGMEASFENALEIENIFTRVTGDSASTINGTLSAQGGANLFLMNPNGIVFGQDASINIGGSFIATTADSIQFQDGTEFAASPTEDSTPLLTNEIPIGLGFGSQSSGEIVVNGEGNEITSTLSPTQFDREAPTGLSVDNDNTLALVGGDISFYRGVVSSQGGLLYLTSVESGSVTITQTDEQIAIENDGATGLKNITLGDRSLVHNKNGSITVNGKNIDLTDGSFILSQNSGNESAGAVNVTASDSLTLSGKSSNDIFSSVRTETVETGTGKGADINLSALKIIMEDESRIQASTTNDAQAGNINVNVSESIDLTNASFSSATFSNAQAGNVNVITDDLEIADAGRITSASFGDSTGAGDGDGGTVSIVADTIEVAGGSTVERSSISSSTFTEGNAGNVSVTTRQLQVRDGASVSSSTFATGDAGNLAINASEAINVEGSNEELIVTDNTQSYIRTSSQGATAEGQDRLGLPEEPVSQAGSLTINTPQLNIFDRGTVSVENEGTGNAGTLSINANNINLDNSGNITATSASGQGGNIELNTLGLQIENQSDITAEAEGDSGGGNINISATNITAKKNSGISANAEGGEGGNITIDTETLLGLQNSDITANAVEGDGGNINITATSILGFEERPELTPLSDITASSEFGVDGTVNINSPETNAEEDVQVSAKKPEAPLTPLELVKGCQLPEGILTTRGRGVPESPYPFPFGYLDHDRDVYKLAEETLRKERERKQREERENGISKREAEERRKARELAMLREKQRLLPNRHEHLMYEVTDNRDEGAMLLPAPKGKLVEPADGRTDKNAIPAFYSESNELPPISQEKRLRQEGNVLVINPDGSQHFVRMFLMSHPTEEMCQSTVGSK